MAVAPRSYALVGVSAAVAGGAGYLAILIAARQLGAAAYAEFSVFWSLLFVVVGFLFGVQQEVTRVTREAEDAPAAPASGPRLAAATVGIGAVIGVLVLATSPLWGPTVLGSDWALEAALIAAIAVLATGQFTATGMLGGRARWGAFSLLISLEAVVRLALFGLVAVLAPIAPWFAVATAAAYLAWLAVAAAHRALRGDLVGLRAATSLRATVGRLIQTMLAAGASGVLVNGFPAILALVVAAGIAPIGDAELGVLVLLVMLTRAPLMVPLNSFTSALVTRFVDERRQSGRVRPWRPVLLVLAASAVLAVLAAVAGPPLLPIVFGAEYTVTPLLAAALTASAAGIGLMTVTGAAVLAIDAHGWYLGGWAISLVATLGLLVAVPFEMTWRVVVALALGPVCGAVVQWAVLHSRAVPAEPDPIVGSGALER